MGASSTPDFCLVGGPASGVAGLDDGARRGVPLTTRYYDGSIAAQQSVTVKGYSKRCE